MYGTVILRSLWYGTVILRRLWVLNRDTKEFEGTVNQKQYKPKNTYTTHTNLS